MSPNPKIKACPRVCDLPQKTIVLVCWDCQRIAVYSHKRYCDLVGWDSYAPDAKTVIAREVCPKAADPNAMLFEMCKIQYYRPNFQNTPDNGTDIDV